MQRNASPGPTLPWWRVGLVWLVIGGPLLVIGACVLTAVLAVRGADPVLRPKLESAAPLTPAMQARNHAATPGR